MRISCLPPLYTQILLIEDTKEWRDQGRRDSYQGIRGGKGFECGVIHTGRSAHPSQLAL